MTRCTAVLSAVVALFFSGCAFLSPVEDTVVEIAPPPDSWAEALPGIRFTVVYVDDDGSLSRVALEDGVFSAVIPCRKTPNSPVLAFPWNSSAPLGVLRPEGGFVETSQGRLLCTLDWEEGPLAVICLLLWKAGFDPGTFNIERLGGYLNKRTDPWEWDLPGICQKIVAGDFSAYDVDPLVIKEIRIQLPEGEWVCESPFFPPLLSTGAPMEIELVMGMHAFFSPGCGRMNVYVGEGGGVQCAGAALY
jgi:hypothetical protein